MKNIKHINEETGFVERTTNLEIAEILYGRDIAEFEETMRDPDPNAIFMRYGLYGALLVEYDKFGTGESVIICALGHNGAQYEDECLAIIESEWGIKLYPW